MEKKISIEKACKEFNAFVDNVMRQHYDMQWCAAAKTGSKKSSWLKIIRLWQVLFILAHQDAQVIIQ